MYRNKTLVYTHYKTLVYTHYEIKVSHHLPNICFYNLSFNNSENDDSKLIPQYDYCESNIIKFNDVLETKLSTCNFTPNEESFNDFTKLIHESIDECFKIDPTQIKTKRHRLTNPWITNGLINSINYKDVLYRNWKKSKTKNDKFGDQNLYQKYKEYRKTLQNLIRNAKSIFYSKKFDQCTGNSKKNGH